MESSIFPNLKRAHARRLRDLYRSAGWPYQDVIEIELLAAGLLERIPDDKGVDCMRVTDAGIQYLAVAAQTNRDALSTHNTLVDKIAKVMLDDGRIVWKGLQLRAPSCMRVTKVSMICVSKPMWRCTWQRKLAAIPIECQYRLR